MKHVYFAAGPDGLTKVGISSDPQRRARNLSRRIGESVSVVHTIPACDGKDERAVHEHFEHRRADCDLPASSEWFHLTGGDIEGAQHWSTEGLWSRHDVAWAIRCSPDHVEALADRGLIPSCRVGPLLRFRPSMVALVEDTTRSCPTCSGTRTVPHWQPHDGRDYPDKRGWLERRMVPCPDCTA